VRPAAVDIGTNSIRLLVVDERGKDLDRREVVTGLGRGVDRSGVLGAEPMTRTLDVLDAYRRIMADHGAGAVRAVATSAVRDASNREEFLAAAAVALGVRPECIDGAEEARLAYRGATSDWSGEHNPMVIDIGGGSTEFVTADGEVSVDIGSVRLTERVLGSQPATFDQLVQAASLVEELLAGVTVPDEPPHLIGVAGTWVSLAGIQHGARQGLHNTGLTRIQLDHVVARLAASTHTELSSIPGLDPSRGPVILGGAIVARQALRHLRATEVLVSERDLLDGVVAGLSETPDV
jgi:exopolyphosphatase/guanosine-5'-triphosphate,3'-diphosphate pyrophosphatase